MCASAYFLEKVCTVFIIFSKEVVIHQKSGLIRIVSLVEFPSFLMEMNLAV